MSNTITISSLAENIFRARDTVAREAAGAITSVLVNSSPEGVSINGTVNSFVTAAPTLNSSYTPAMTIPAGDDQTVSALTMTIGQTANVRIPINGEVFKSLNNTAGGNNVLDAMLSQAIRVMVNAIETHVCLVAKQGASRGTGTAATDPFATDQKPLSDLRKILFDNGTPMDDGQLSLIINSTAGTNLRKVANLYKANEAGGSDLLRRGELLNLYGFSIKESAGIATHTKGTAASATTNNAGYAVGATSLTLASAGTGTLLAGDLLTFAGDSTIYGVKTGDADVSDGGTLVLNNPGLRVAMSAATKAITEIASYTPNVGFHRNAIELVMRPPAMPSGGDAAIDRMTISDPVTGLVFEAALYKGYGMNMLDLTVYYQAKVWKSEFVATLIG